MIVCPHVIIFVSIMSVHSCVSFVVSHPAVALLYRADVSLTSTLALSPSGKFRWFSLFVGHSTAA